MTEEDPSEDRSGSSVMRTTGRMVNVTAALMSLGLIAGVGYWGYKLVLRDVSGVPVVRALEGEMRISPADPGGEAARHQGLAVNAVAEETGAEAPEDRLVLAPPPVALAPEDVPGAELEVAPPEETATAPAAEVQTEEPTLAALVAPETPETAEAIDTPDGGQAAAEPDDLDTDAILALAEQIAASVTPLTAPVPADVDPEFETATGEAVARSILPVARRIAVTPAGETPRQVAATAPVVSDTELVQLGAYDSPETAEAEWVRISTRFDDYFEGKRRVVEEASRAGRTFYRLRAAGFADMADARRFCAALVAEGADCIPVVIR